MPEGETKDQPSILLIDDEERVLTTVARGLRAAGMSVRTAIDGERGLAALAEEEPDAVILDVMMPAMDGFEVCRRIRGLSRTYVPVLLASALDPYEVWPRAVEVGADDVLQKPANLHEMRSRARNMVKLRRWHRALAAMALARDDRTTLTALLANGSGSGDALSEDVRHALSRLLLACDSCDP